MAETLKGTCLCGSVAYEVNDPEAMGYCHCTRCQRWTGSSPGRRRRRQGELRLHRRRRHRRNLRVRVRPPQLLPHLRRQHLRRSRRQILRRRGPDARPRPHPVLPPPGRLQSPLGGDRRQRPPVRRESSGLIERRSLVSQGRQDALNSPNGRRGSGGAGGPEGVGGPGVEDDRVGVHAARVRPLAGEGLEADGQRELGEERVDRSAGGSRRATARPSRSAASARPAVRPVGIARGVEDDQPGRRRSAGRRSRGAGTRTRSPRRGRATPRAASALPRGR